MICPYAKIPPCMRRDAYRAAAWKPADRKVARAGMNINYIVGLHHTRWLFERLEARP